MAGNKSSFYWFCFGHRINLDVMLIPKLYSFGKEISKIVENEYECVKHKQFKRLFDNYTKSEAFIACES